MTQPATITTVLGFDYGLKRIGVATGQTITATATPLTTLVQDDRDTHWELIADLVVTWQPDAIVVGIPTLLDGTATDMTRAARAFAAELEQRYHLPVFLFDETLTSREAEERLKQQGKLGQHNKSEIDKMAAAIIVQGWLDQHTA